MQNHHSLCIEPIEYQQDLVGHDCGNYSINTTVMQSYYPHILKQAKTYKILLSDIIIGFYCISIGSINLENSNSDIADYYHGTPEYGFLKLNYLAVDKSLQNKGIGSTILKMIVVEAHSLCQRYPIRLLVIDALTEKVEWYKKRGFRVLFQKQNDSENRETVKMFIDLISDQDRLIVEKYIDEAQ